MTETEPKLNRIWNELEACKSMIRELTSKLIVENAGRISAEGNLTELANEYCIKCGQYKTEHLGSCNDCRWLKARKGEFE